MYYSTSPMRPSLLRSFRPLFIFHSIIPHRRIRPRLPIHRYRRLGPLRVLRWNADFGDLVFGGRILAGPLEVGEGGDDWEGDWVDILRCRLF
jgi:hypothetical protein